MKLLIIGLFYVLSFQASNVQASVIDNGLYTTDTESGLDWLDVTETVGMSLSDVFAQLNAGGSYEGWRYASGDEFNTLIFNYTGELTNGYDLTEQAEHQIDDLITLFGGGVSAGLRPLFGGQPFPSGEIIDTSVLGLLSDIHGDLSFCITPPGEDPCTPPPLELWAAGIAHYLIDSVTITGPTGTFEVNLMDSTIAHNFYMTAEESNASVGSFLVRDSSTPESSPVPAPSYFVLLVAGLLVFTCMSRRKFSL